MGGGVCPVSGEPLLGGQTISRTAVARVGTAVSDLPELLDDLDYVAGGLSHGDSAVGGGVPSSKEPVNLSLVLEVWEAVDLLAEWANALLVFVMGPKYRLPVGKDPRAIRRVFQSHAEVHPYRSYPPASRQARPQSPTCHSAHLLRGNQ